MEQNKPQTEQELTQQAAVRRQKLADLCEAGHNPFVIKIGRASCRERV